MEELIKKIDSDSVFILQVDKVEDEGGWIELTLADVANEDNYICSKLTKQEAIFLAKSILLQCESLNK